MSIKILITIFKKTWYIFLIIILYIVFGSLNLIPLQFNIFKKNKVEILETPVLIKEIKDIGQLICAEYYGEVYADLFEAYDELLEDSLSESQLLVLYKKHRFLKKYMKLLNNRTNEDEIDTINSKLVSVQNQKERLLEEQKKYNNEVQNLKDTLSTMKRRKNREKYKEFKENLKTARTNYKTTTDELYKANVSINKIKKEIKTIMQDSTLATRRISNFKKSNNIIYIGRGTVIAGIDLMNMKEGNIDTIEPQILSIRISKPMIIDTIINPWFIRYDNLLINNKKKKKDNIAEKGILGYEIVIAKKSRYYDADIKLIKHKCLTKLAEAAETKNILVLAERSANNTLESFFYLLGFKEVRVNFIE